MLLSKDGITHDTEDFGQIRRLKSLGFVEEKAPAKDAEKSEEKAPAKAKRTGKKG